MSRAQQWQIKELTPQAVTEKEIARLFEINASVAEELSLEKLHLRGFTSWFGDHYAFHRRNVTLLQEGPTIIAFALGGMLHHDPSTWHAAVTAPKNSNRAEAARALLLALCQNEHVREASCLKLKTQLIELQQLYANWGGILRAEEPEIRLSLSKMDWGLVESWRSEIGHELVTFERLPDDFAQEYLDDHNRVYDSWRTHGYNTPCTDLAMRRNEEALKSSRGITWLTCAFRAPNGGFSAMTDVGVQPGRAPWIQQYFTGVRTEWRGLGLGKAIKAEMLREIRRRFADATTIYTQSFKENAPMRAINQMLGFDSPLVAQLYDFKPTELEKKLRLAAG